MNITELDQFNIRDSLKFHNRLNPRLWDSRENLHPEVRQALLAIANDFAEFLGVGDLDIVDITISGSNAAYNYTPQSDIDLHLVVDVPEMNQEVYRELFNAKKYQYNDQHNITIGDADVELYVQLANEPHISQGIYSVKNDRWLSVPRRKAAKIDDSSVQHKYEDLSARIKQAIKSRNEKKLSAIIKKLKNMRSAGLAQHGEFGTDNLVFKLLRSQGLIQQLYDARLQAHSDRLSIEEDEPDFRYGFGEASYSTPDGVAPTTCMFLNEKESNNHELELFFNYVVQRLGIEQTPELIIHNDSSWSEDNASFGAYNPDTHVLHLSTYNRHTMDIMRTMAHELTHARQNELGQLGDDSGETGSPQENQANSVAGEIMRDWGRSNPEMFSEAAKKPAPPREYVPPPPAAKRQQYTQEYLDNLAKTYSEKHGVPLDMVQHVMKKETGWMPDPSARAYAVSPKYATGVMQVMPQYHRQYGITDPYNPEQSMSAGTKMLRQHLDTFKDPKLALAAYNAGPTAVRKYGGVPPFPETQKYVQDYTPPPAAARTVPNQPEPSSSTGFLDTIASKGKELAQGAADWINRATAPAQLDPKTMQPIREQEPKPSEPAQPSIQGGLNFLRQLHGLSKITRAGAEEELKGIVRDVVRGQSPGAPQNPTGKPVQESSGYIPTEREKNDPRFEMALTVDIHPGETGRQANKMALKTDKQGRPALLRASGKV